MPFATILDLPATTGELLRLSDEDRRMFRAAFAEPFRFPAGTDVIREATTRPRVLGIEEGWLASYTLLPGGQRQVIQFNLPGDVIGLRDLLLTQASHSTVALTEVCGRSASANAFVQLMADNSRLGIATVWMMGRAEAHVVDNLVNLGQRSAVEAIAALIHDITQRLERIGRRVGSEFDVPISQALLADAIGISAVHVSRSLRKLREDGILDLQGQRVRILSPAGLADLADGFGPRLIE